MRQLWNFLCKIWNFYSKHYVGILFLICGAEVCVVAYLISSPAPTPRNLPVTQPAQVIKKDTTPQVLNENPTTDATDTFNAEANLVPNVPDPNVKVYVDKNSVKEYSDAEITYRNASVVHTFINPLKVHDKDVYYVFQEMGFQCENKLSVIISATLYGKDSTDPLFVIKKMGEVEPVEPGSAAAAELEYVCKLKATQVKPKTEDTYKPIKSRKMFDI